jgi:histidine triad (HIT) family protein
MTDCLFCKIVNKQIPANIVYEDTDVVAFLDIRPVHPGHTLVIPKVHSADFSEMDPVDREAVMHTTQKISQALLHAGAQGANVLTNIKPAGHQVIFHTHMHVIPRYNNDGLKTWPQQPYKEGEDKVWKQKIAQLLSKHT